MFSIFPQRMVAPGPANRPAEAALLRWYTNDSTVVAMLCLALFLVVAGIRFWTIGEFGTDVPYWDQWGLESKLYLRHFEGTLPLTELLAPHNEHRILFTRLLLLGLIDANGQWDARLQMIANSTFYATFAGALFLLFAKKTSPGFWVAVFIALVLSFAHPFGWENTVWGFQSQFYFLAASSIAAMWLLVNTPAFTTSWFAGCIVACCGLFTMASGLMAPLAIFGTLLVAYLRERPQWRSLLKDLWPTFVICALIACAGFLLSVKVEAHTVHQAHDLQILLRALRYCLSWPGVIFSGWWIVNWLPFSVLVLFYLRKSLPDGRHERFIIAIGIWVLLQAVATAYARAGIIGSSRYADMLSFGFVVNCLSIYRISQGASRYRLVRPACLVFAAIWLVGNFHGVFIRSQTTLAQELLTKQLTQTQQKARTAGYVSSREYEWLTLGIQYKLDIPYWDAKEFSEILDNARIRSILPPSVGEPLFMKSSVGNPTLTLNTNMVQMAPPFLGERVWGSRSDGDSLGWASTAAKRQGLPFIFFYVYGDYSLLSVTDANKVGHPVVPLALKGSNKGWMPAYAYCPGPVVTIGSASSDSSAQLAFTEPREMGRLSLIALVLTERASLLIGAGGVAFCAALILIAIRTKCRKSERTNTCET